MKLSDLEEKKPNKQQNLCGCFLRPVRQNMAKVAQDGMKCRDKARKSYGFGVVLRHLLCPKVCGRNLHIVTSFFVTRFISDRGGRLLCWASRRRDPRDRYCENCVSKRLATFRAGCRPGWPLLLGSVRQHF